MTQQKLCQQCGQSQSCRQVYQQLGGMQGPSVVWKVIIAFLLPMAVFIGALVVFEEILAEWINLRELLIILSFLSALLATFIFIYILKLINNRRAKLC